MDERYMHNHTQANLSTHMYMYVLWNIVFLVDLCISFPFFRFSFLDFTEYNSSEASLDSGVISGRSLEVHSPSRRK